MHATTAGAGDPAPALLRRTAHRIGPNAITRVAEALDALHGRALTEDVFAAAGLGRHLDHPPQEMVDEDDVARLHRALHGVLGEEGAAAVARDAGHRTGSYLLAHRIPRPAQAVLRILPPRLAARVLAGAIARHAWTFAGSGRFSYEPGHPFAFMIAGCPLCRGTSHEGPACAFYAATFERIFGELVSRRARVRETACAATGAPACRFVATW